ncbi:MAG: UDP-2,3-diacylglucosamine diphosphatase [Ignavibacteriae bacterium]|nr:UDP-2,3-diacylglucosamine diphosphatase [Ignavibacteriota bacterium]
MPQAYFISDAHLGLGSREEERKKEDHLLTFLEHISKDASELFIVGDLFDTWFEYRTVIPKGFHRLLAKLDDLTHCGISVHYLAGNHDYWMKDFFDDELGIKTYHDAFDTMVDGKKIFIHHGDGLANGDFGYRILKKILRNRLNIKLFTVLHPDIGITLARSSSKKSRRYTLTKNNADDNGMLKFARQKIQEGFDVVIMGHCHQPMMKELGTGLYINLGDWIAHHTYAQIGNGKIELNVWRQ